MGQSMFGAGNTVKAMTLFVVMCIVSPTGTAWEVDVHYVLTSWLAEKAGFSSDNAQQIAQADQSIDDSDHHAAIPTMVAIFLLGTLVPHKTCRIVTSRVVHAFPALLRVALFAPEVRALVMALMPPSGEVSHSLRCVNLERHCILFRILGRTKEFLMFRWECAQDWPVLIRKPEAAGTVTMPISHFSIKTRLSTKPMRHTRFSSDS